MSPFKDNLEAAIARAESAEAERDRLEKRIAELENPPKPLPQSPPEPEPPVAVVFSSNPGKADERFYMKDRDKYDAFGKRRDKIQMFSFFYLCLALISGGVLLFLMIMLFFFAGVMPIPLFIYGVVCFGAIFGFSLKALANDKRINSFEEKLRL